MVASYHTHFDKYFSYYHLDMFTPLLWKYIRWFHEPFQRIFVPSMETEAVLQSQGLQNTTIWTRGVDCDAFSPAKHNSLFIRERYNITKKYLFMYSGRLAPEKDLDILTDIIRALPPPLKDNVHWLIVGDGPSYKELSKNLESYPVTFTGYLNGDTLARAYASSDLLVFPSSTETFGNVVLESLASGTPAVVADKGGVASIVSHKHTGFICKSRNAQSFIDGITALAKDSITLTEMGKSARMYARSQSWSTILGNLLVQYEEVLFEKKRSITA
jgi:glycosyltransferase involved in cell wall biosynthesis